MNRKTRPDVLEADIEQVDRFNRFYEQRLEQIRERALPHELSWTEIRVFHVMGQLSRGASPAWLNARLRLDPGYLCRILKKFRAYGFAMERRCVRDRRYRDYELTQWGRSIYRDLREFHRGEARRMLAPMPPRHQRRLVRAMHTIEDLLTRDPLDFLLERSCPAALARRFTP